MDNLFMFDAFKALDSLNEDTFKVDDEGIEEFSEFERMHDIDDSIEIIDMQAEDEEELEDSYIGKVILACNVCDSKVFEDKDNVIIDEETPDSANTDTECPYCHTVDGFKIIGEIGEFHKHDDKEEARKRWERKKNDARSKRDYRMKHDLEESLEGNEKLQEASNKWLRAIQNWIKNPEAAKIIYEWYKNEEAFEDFDNSKEFIEFAEDDIYEMLDAAEETEDKKIVMHALGIEDETLEEDFKGASITTDTEKMEMFSDENGKVTITTEPINSTEEKSFEDGEEVIVPVSDETEAEIESNSEEEAEEKIVEESLKDEIDVDFDDIDEESFDELAESYLKTIYSNVESYKTTNASATADKFMLEGLITFASGSVKNTNFVFAPKAATKSGKLQFIGENLQITKNRNAFKFNASISDKKLLGESLTYNYSTKDSAGKVRKLYGTIKRK